MLAALFGETKEATGLEASDVVAFMAIHKTVGARENVNEVLPLFHDNCTLRIDTNLPGITDEFLNFARKSYLIGGDICDDMLFDLEKFDDLMQIRKKANPDVKKKIGAVVKASPHHYVIIQDFTQARTFSLSAEYCFRHLYHLLIKKYPDDVNIVNDVIEFLPDFMGFIIRY